jgi:hypothetical protein
MLVLAITTQKIFKNNSSTLPKAMSLWGGSLLLRNSKQELLLNLWIVKECSVEASNSTYTLSRAWEQKVKENVSYTSQRSLCCIERKSARGIQIRQSPLWKFRRLPHYEFFFVDTIRGYINYSDMERPIYIWFSVRCMLFGVCRGSIKKIINP